MRPLSLAPSHPLGTELHEQSCLVRSTKGCCQSRGFSVTEQVTESWSGLGETLKLSHSTLCRGQGHLHQPRGVRLELENTP